MYPNAPTQPLQVRKGMAIASLVIAIISLITCGGACVGPIAAIILGIIAINRANREPGSFGGKGLAIAGVIISIGSIGAGVIAALAVPNMIKSKQMADEMSALSTLKTIETAEATYQLTAGKGKFADLRTLADQGLVDSGLGMGLRGGYRFTAAPMIGPNQTAMYDAFAVPLTSGRFGTGSRSFGTNETNVIYQAEGAVELRGTRTNRRPVGGRPIAELMVSNDLLAWLRAPTTPVRMERFAAAPDMSLK